MASKLSAGEVTRIAELARLELTPDEVLQFAGELTAILTYAELIQQVDTTAVHPATGHAEAGFREDEPRASLARDVVLQEAPDAAADAGLFRVPKVL